MKTVLLIIDGLGDLPVGSLGGRTPLEAAATPNLDRLAGAGNYGLVDPIRPGEVPNTHSGAGVLLGMFPGQAGQLFRGPVEAAGLGLELQPGDVALRSNFATLESLADGFQVLDRRAGRIDAGTQELSALFDHMDLGDGISVSLTPTEQHRGVLVLSGPGLDVAISDTDPGDRALPAKLPECRALQPGAEFTAGLLNRFTRIAHERLSGHPVNRDRAARGELPANGIIVRGAGLVAEMKNLVLEQGLSACVVSGCNTVSGLGRILGFDVVNDERFTADLDTNLDAKFSAAIGQLARHDLAYVHIKAPDLCAHDRQPLAKRDFLERLDTALSPLLEQELLVAVAADHTTDSNTGLHTADPVPALTCFTGNFLPGKPVKFGESACRAGNLARQGSHQFLKHVINLARGA